MGTPPRYIASPVRFSGDVVRDLDDLFQMTSRNREALRLLPIADIEQASLIVDACRYHVILEGRTAYFALFDGSGVLPAHDLASCSFIPTKIVQKPKRSRRAENWLKIYGILVVNERQLWARLWFFISDFPKATLGLDRSDTNIMVRDRERGDI
ncbi:MAG: hypothetical protein UV42_C0008G0012 [Candidatus Magasanikbacteria bacterium GW2011_GWE2_42_7]|uniref:Uncharacterized protein n=1 Tax=Candidatus Magasanikbacteria bacterium GW2011_GWE2_42_7 TaxID=1619052 RepID=A0A0G1ED38_9BACT|nr:MAG: hypothetical protein UV42_C0008G0012 [Candidatus Magasanikbacteria bacterium GW2011_GWE2_42_7]